MPRDLHSRGVAPNQRREDEYINAEMWPGHVLRDIKSLLKPICDDSFYQHVHVRCMSMSLPIKNEVYHQAFILTASTARCTSITARHQSTVSRVGCSPMFIHVQLNCRDDNSDSGKFAKDWLLLLRSKFTARILLSHPAHELERQGTF